MMTFEDRKSPVIELQWIAVWSTTDKRVVDQRLSNPSERALADSYKIMGWGIRAFLEGSDFKVASLKVNAKKNEGSFEDLQNANQRGKAHPYHLLGSQGFLLDGLLSERVTPLSQDLTKAVVEYVPNIHHYGSGAKIKRSYTKQHNLPTPARGHFGQMLGGKEINPSSELCPVDSSTSISKFHGKEKFSSKRKETREAEVGLDLHPMQSVFLGPDRRYNRYWLFLGPCNANDPGHKRVYFESSEDGHWEVIDTEEAFCALLSVLDGRGKREAFLLASLEKRKASLCQEMSSRIAIHSGSTSLTQYDRSDLYMIREDSSSPVSDIVDNPCATDITNDFLASSGAIVLGVGKKGEEQKQRWRRLQEFDAWIWSSFYSDLNAVKHGKRTYLDSLARCESCHDLYWRDEKHCKTCHTTFELDFDLEEKYAIHIATCREKEDNDMFPKHKVLSSQLQSLKAAIHAIESVMPEDALVEAWSKSAHKLWVRRLRRTSYLTELLQVLADFVGAIKEDWLCQSDVVLGSNNLLEEIVVSFSTMPQTSSAVALWLVKLDALIAPHLERVQLHSKKRTRN
ncbi:Homeobox-DDT domain protein RLT3 [Vitis vinifera]|uniref:Homeobox-DDT domain protein RLT3 n=1 Tax=Vitis vinifera TaxID=29760 RepID=A0A438HYX9_VITVI|nr:Homeobox-DDT domain protein RLT3 [Vitis vinifera]